MGNAAIAGIETENARSQAQQQAQLEAATQRMQSSFSNELQGDIDAQTGQYIRSQFDAASKADFAMMDAERGVITNGIAQYGTGFLAPLATMLTQPSAANMSMATQASQGSLAETGTPGFGTPNDVAYYDQNGELNIPIVAHIGSKSGPSVYDAIENGVNNVVNGALSTAVNMVYQPIAQVHDLGAIAYGSGYQAITGETYQPNWWSAIGQHADDDSFGTLAENVLSSNPVTGVGVAGWNIGTAIYNGDINSLETQAGGLLAGFAMGKALGPEAEMGMEPEGGMPNPPKIDPKILDEILNTKKGARPDPATYLSQEYINSHLSMFEDGVAKFYPAVPPSGVIGPPGGTFVMPRFVADQLEMMSGGNVSTLEAYLSLKPGTLGNSPVRIDIPSPEGLRMPSGKELGASTEWLPGGYTRGGIPEATISPAKPGTYVVRQVIQSNGGW